MLKKTGLFLLLGGCLACSVVWAQVPLEGYDSQKLANPAHQSPKYIFGRIAQKYPLDQVKSKEDAGKLLQQMLPELRAAGLEVSAVQGDKILVKTSVGWEMVDVVRGAGGGNPGWWWGSDGVPYNGPTPGGENPPSGTPPSSGKPGTSVPAAGGELSTVPHKPEYAQASFDTSSQDRAIQSAAEWVKSHHPELFVEGDDRDKAYEMMTVLIGVLRAKGFDVHRVVNHPSRPVGHPMRYGSDALVIDGKIYDCYGALGDPGRSTPQALYQGPYAAGRLRE